MRRFSRKPSEPIEEVTELVWTCESSSCSGWMRAEFSLTEHPSCPLCQSSMVKREKMIPKIQNIT